MDKYRNRILLPVGDLENGKHEFDFRLESDFFAQFDNPEIIDGEVSVEIDVEKVNGYLNVEIHFDGELSVACDRCLDEMTVEVDGDDVLSVRFGESHSAHSSEMENEKEEDVMYLKSGEDTLDLTEYIYEGICLSLPIRQIHPDDEHGNSTCNPEMLKYLSADRTESNSPFGALKDKV
jgi:uncharacterized metal-binding protein YceD (DUF177 family)